MTANQAINKIRVLLGVEEPVTEKVELANAKLVDGTEVSVEGDFEVGKTLSVVTEEGSIPAPAGVHQTTDNMLVTVDEAGIITQIEEISDEAQEEEKEEMEENKEEVAMEEHGDKEEEMEEEEKVEMEEEMIIKIVDAMKPYFEEIKEMQKEVEEMKAKFQKFSKEPAAKPIKKAEAFEANRVSSVERIAKIRKSK